MDEDRLSIRAASADDAAELVSIYAPYVRQTAITFEYEVPTAEEFRSVSEKHSQGTRILLPRLMA